MTKFELPPPEDDGLVKGTVKPHSAQKHHFLARYIHAFTTAMRKKWPCLHYVDLFAGAGIDQEEATGELCWGSPLIAAQSPVKFDQLHVCEKNNEKCEALRHRLAQFAQPQQPQIINGNANEAVDAIVAAVPNRALTLAFLDPFGAHLDLDSVATLSRLRVDLVVFFPDYVDMLRNWKKYYYENPLSNLDFFFGRGADWRALLEQCPPQQRAQKLRDLYVEKLRILGYEHFEFERISAVERPLYLLIFCSKHRLGGQIWRGIAAHQPDKQRRFNFDD